MLATTSAVALLYQDGVLDLDLPVSDTTLLGAAFAGNGKATITTRNLLLHNSGLPAQPSPTFYSSAVWGTAMAWAWVLL